MEGNLNEHRPLFDFSLAFGETNGKFFEAGNS
jgi:hypothetical protein